MPPQPSPIAQQVPFKGTSPLDLLAGAKSPNDVDASPALVIPPRGALLERAVKVSRTSSIKRPTNVGKLEGASTRNGRPGGDSPPFDQENRAFDQQQKVRDVRAARLSRQEYQQNLSSQHDPSSSSTHQNPFQTTPSPSSSSSPPSSSREIVDRSPTPLISNAFRDSIASDVSFNTITGDNERKSMYAGDSSMEDGRITEALRGLSLRRRQSVDTVRSSEFGEGGRWDRAWADSDDDDDDDEEEIEEEEEKEERKGSYGDDATPCGGVGARRKKHGVSSVALSDADIEGMSQGGGLGALGSFGRQQASQWQEESSTGKHVRNTADKSGNDHLLLQDVPDKQHFVSLTRSTQQLQPRANDRDDRKLALNGASPHISRRDTLRSMAGDVGDSSMTDDGDYAPRRASHEKRNSVSTIGADSSSSDSSGSNAHVYVWPPTPSGSVRDSIDADEASTNNVSRRDTLKAVPAGVGVGQRAVIEYTPGDDHHESTPSLSSQNMNNPVSPSAAPSNPLDTPIVNSNDATIRRPTSRIMSQERTSGHPTGRPPPPAPQDLFGYTDPNEAMLPELGKMRRKAIEEHDGRESLVSDLDVETLKLDGSSGSSEDWESRRGSDSSLGSLSSEKIRDMRNERDGNGRRSGDSFYSIPERDSVGPDQQPRYQVHAQHQSHIPPGGQQYPKRPSAIEMPAQDHWGASLRRGASQPSPKMENVDPMVTALNTPKRSNTQPDEALTAAQQEQQQYQRYQQEQEQSRQQLQQMSRSGQFVTQSPNSPTLHHQQQPRALNAPQRPPLTADRRAITAPDGIHSLAAPGTPQATSTPMQKGGSTGGFIQKNESVTPVSSTLDSRTPSHVSFATTMGSVKSSLLDSKQQQKRSSSKSAVSGGTSSNSKAEAFLTLGITHHESGDLSRSAYYFERSAKVEGGCVVGMCMWGMALREGWGARKDQRKGFEWISRAAARAGELMASGGGSSQKSDAELKAIRSELKLSVYELGKCFCYGWGIKMDKLMALEYFELAAKLGDADAQAEAGALLAAGKGGCKKDLKKAAMYYRMAEAQGYDTVGLSWIHKEKYS